MAVKEFFTKYRLYIVLCVITLVLVAGGIIAYVLNVIDKGKALKDDATNITTLTQNLYSTETGSDRKLIVNSSAVAELLNAINYSTYTASDTSYTAHDIISRNGGTNDNTIKFAMGYFVDKNGELHTDIPLYWQIVYLRNGYLTIWLDKCYTVSLFNSSQSSSGSTYGYINANTSPFATYDTRPETHAYNGNYSYSTIRDVTKNIFNLLNNNLTNFGGDNGFIVSPQDANATWQATQENLYYNSNNWTITSGLQSNSSGNDNGTSDITDTNPYNWTWNVTDSPYSDSFWIPSYNEVFTSQSTGESVETGLWGLDVQDLTFGDGQDSTSTTNSTYCYDESVYNGYYNRYPYICWLRSGSNSNAAYATRLYSSGTIDAYSVFGSRGVRPACIISLSKLVSSIPINITINTNDSSMGTVYGNGVYVIGNVTKIIATPNAGYTLIGWSLDGGQTLLSDSLGKTEYTITVTQDATYTAVFEPIVTLTSLNSGSEFSITRESVDNVVHSYVIQMNSGYYINGIYATNTTTAPTTDDFTKIKSIDGYLLNDYSTAIHYITNTTGTELIIEIYNANEPFIIYLNFVQKPPKL